jgi:transcriptional regulator GlxA family with amidase domain
MVQGMDSRILYLADSIHKNVSQRLSIRTLAASVNLSERRLREVFSKEIGISLKQYIKAVRMERALLLLRSSFLSVKEVVREAGFGDTSHFVRDFKALYGRTPSEYRTEFSTAGTANKPPFLLTRKARLKPQIGLKGICIRDSPRVS